jgi:hypothetical protein
MIVKELCGLQIIDASVKNYPKPSILVPALKYLIIVAQKTFVGKIGDGTRGI